MPYEISNGRFYAEIKPRNSYSTIAIEIPTVPRNARGMLESDAGHMNMLSGLKGDLPRCADVQTFDVRVPGHSADPLCPASDVPAARTL